MTNILGHLRCTHLHDEDGCSCYIAANTIASVFSPLEFDRLGIGRCSVVMIGVRSKVNTTLSDLVDHCFESLCLLLCWLSRSTLGYLTLCWALCLYLVHLCCRRMLLCSLGHMPGFQSLPDLNLFPSWRLWHILTLCPYFFLCHHVLLREVLAGEVGVELGIGFVRSVEADFVSSRYPLVVLVSHLC